MSLTERLSYEAGPPSPAPDGTTLSGQPLTLPQMVRTGAQWQGGSWWPDW